MEGVRGYITVKFVGAVFDRPRANTVRPYKKIEATLIRFSRTTNGRPYKVGACQYFVAPF